MNDPNQPMIGLEHDALEIIAFRLNGQDIRDLIDQQGGQIQSVPEVAASFDRSFSDGIITLESGMICFLNLARMFNPADLLAA